MKMIDRASSHSPPPCKVDCNVIRNKERVASLAILPSPQPKEIMKRTDRAIAVPRFHRPGRASFSHGPPRGPPSPFRNAPGLNSCVRSSISRKTCWKVLRSNNSPKIEKAGKALKKLSEGAEWEVATIPNATDYVMLTTDFQRHADELVKQAKAKNIDGATLAYLKLTMSCVRATSLFAMRRNRRFQ